MANRFISPALADLSQDIAGNVSLDIVKQWMRMDGTEREAEEMLRPYAVKGTVVSTDTSGLSRLSMEEDLLDVLKFISDPKEIIFAQGTSLGGTAIGRWVADNTQMFYGEAIAISDIVRSMVLANDMIMKECRVLVGFCIHYGTFLNIGGGLYGKDADFVETVAENLIRGGEILVSESVAIKIRGETGYALSPAKDLDGRRENLHRLHAEQGDGKSDLKDRDYPIYFDKTFFSLLRRLNENGVRDAIYRDYLQKKIVVLFQRDAVDVAPHLGGLLDSMVINAVFSATLKNTALLSGNTRQIKCSGSLAIFIFEPGAMQTAIRFSREAQQALLKNLVPCTAGIDSGEVLVFPLEDGTTEIAGSPVNIASKLATDFGEPGRIYVTDNAAREADLAGHENFRTEISNVVIQGVVI